MLSVLEERREVLAGSRKELAGSRELLAGSREELTGSREELAVLADQKNQTRANCTAVKNDRKERLGP